MGDSADSAEEKVVMTPVRRTEHGTTLVVERKAVGAEPGQHTHVAGGQHTGIVINKENVTENGAREPCHAALEFRVYLVSAGGPGGSGGHSREARALRFWFGARLPPAERAPLAQAFFRELVSPQDFPKDYVGFIKKIMKLMQHDYSELKTLEVELRREGRGAPPAAYMEEPAAPAISEQRVLELIENAYPNPLTVEDFAAANKWSQAEVKDALQALEEQGLTRAMAGGLYVRQHSRDTQVVKQMPALGAARQPTIAVVTALYCEKQAVDAMLDHTETYVRYNTVGESNVYTLGSIGAHRVVTTKLPAVGRSREALTAAGGATTRLLGIFQKVECVLLVGVGGGVAHYADHARHVRLGDVVVSAAPGTGTGTGTDTGTDPQHSYVYVYCERAERNEQGGWDLEVKPYTPANPLLQQLARRLAAAGAWDRCIAEGVARLRGAAGRWEAPAPAAEDRLCVELGDGAYIEVAPPAPPPPNDTTDGGAGGAGGRRVWLAPVCGGRAAGGAARAAVAQHTRARAFDCELAAVLDSVVGNRKDCFIIIRGIADYHDGTRGKAWQGAAAAAAAAAMRAVVAAMDPPRD